jgi:hypothetical protein
VEGRLSVRKQHPEHPASVDDQLPVNQRTPSFNQYSRYENWALTILRSQHEVVDDELLATFKEIHELDFAIWAIKGVVLVQPHHREVTKLVVQSIVGSKGYGFQFTDLWFNETFKMTAHLRM